MTNQPHADRPARPPQILLDNFQRPVALAPGFNMLQAVALELLPVFLRAKMEGVNLTSSSNNGRSVDPIAAAFVTAREFCEYMDRLEENAQKTTLTTV